MATTNPPHLLIFPFPAQGHLLALLDLATHLSTHFSFSITIIITPKNLPLIQPFISSTSKITPLILPLPPSSSLPSSAEHVRALPPNISSSALIHSLSSLRPAILNWAKSNPADALISDFFLGWCKDLAFELKIPHLSFFSVSALLAGILHSLFLSVPIPPPLPSLPPSHLPSIFRRYVPGNLDWEFTKKSLLSNCFSSAAIFNTFNFLDSNYLAHLRSSSYASGNLFAVGQIPSFVRGSIDGGILSFLDSCDDDSVVYICFGSQFAASPEVNAVIKSGLEISGVRFVWAVGGDFDQAEGFEGGNGMVVKGWVEQRAVLEHKAVGAFLTHCGWNSVMEGITAGVMLLMWPMQADQFVNARLLEDVGMAVRVCEGGEEKLPEKEELGRMIREAVEEGGWPAVKLKVKEMERMAKEAVAEGGESFWDMEKMVEFIERGC